MLARTTTTTVSNLVQNTLIGSATLLGAAKSHPESHFPAKISARIGSSRRLLHFCCFEGSEQSSDSMNAA